MKECSRFCFLLLVTLLSFSLFCAIPPVQASRGNIIIGKTGRPSRAVTVQIGESVNLYFGRVDWSGGQVQLHLSIDGYSNISDDDPSFGPAFTVAKIKASEIDNTTYEGYSVGRNWINGTVPKAVEVPAGDYFVKAFDGKSAAVAVTDKPLTITTAFEVVPSSGPPQASMELRGYALPANDYANLSWSTNELNWTMIEDFVQADGIGRLVYAIVAHDLAEALPSGRHSENYSTITYRMIVNSTGETLLDTFDEYQRGLRQVNSPDSVGRIAPSGSLYGNNTNFLLYGFHVKVNSVLIIAGKWFHAGTVTVLWDTELIGTGTAGEDGVFNVTVMVPVTLPGLHNVTIRDAAADFLLQVDCLKAFDVTPPKADAGPDRTVDEDAWTILDGSGSKDNIGIFSYVWTFVDVTPQTLVGAKTAYNFTDPGVYVVTLKVSDVAGNSASDAVVITVRDVTPPVAEAGEEQTVEEKTVVTLDGSRSTDNVEIASYVWSFVDITPKTLDGVTATYNFEEPGTYTITLNVTDTSWNWGTDTVTISVLDMTDPIAEAGSDKIVAANKSLTFDASNSSDNVGIVSYEWDFGDGTKGTGLTANHVYTDTGNYTVVLTVGDEDGNSGTDSVTVTVVVDTDGDGVPDLLDDDDDGDGIPDLWEAANGLDPLDSADASLDSDGDRLSNLEEYQQGTDPRNYFSPFPFWGAAVAIVAMIGIVAAVAALLFRGRRGIG